ncbi:hypothetical protein VTK56DRAFT_2124 [Thermocarpiscus australiensis]
MPRQSRSTARAPARPSVPARTAPAPTQQQQTRPATTYAPSAAAPSAPNPTAVAPQAPPTTSQGPGLLGQMASTAAGVAIGSSIGHVVGNGISSLFGGSSGEPAQATQAQSSAPASQSWGGSNCQGATEQFTKCMDEHGGNMQICGWYLEQLKACQAAAKQF